MRDKTQIPKLCAKKRDTSSVPGLILKNPDSWCIGFLSEAAHEDEE